MRTRGVALLVAVVVVAIITLMATQVSTFTLLDESRVSGMMLADQALEITFGAEGLAQETLQEIINKEPDKINLSQAWAVPQSLPYSTGRIDVQVEDLQGRLNVNNVLNANGTPNLVVIEQLRRLFRTLQIDPSLVDKWVDWVDADNQPYGTNGAEDAVYLSLTPALRPANRPVTSVSSLRYLPGLEPEQYERLRPYLAALPSGTKLNLCTARAAVLASLADGFAAFSQDERQLNQQRRSGCFPKLADVQPILAGQLRDPAVIGQITGQLAENSNYFMVHSTITQGSFSLTSHSVLLVGAGGGAVLRRSVGWE